MYPGSAADDAPHGGGDFVIVDGVVGQSWAFRRLDAASGRRQEYPNIP